MRFFVLVVVFFVKIIETVVSSAQEAVEEAVERARREHPQILLSNPSRYAPAVKRKLADLKGWLSDVRLKMSER